MFMEVWRALPFHHRFISIHYLSYFITQTDYFKKTDDLSQYRCVPKFPSQQLVVFLLELFTVEQK